MADSQRKTANLFDADTWYGAYKISDGVYQTNRNTWYTLVAKPFTNDDIGKSFCFAANIEPSSGNARFAAVINGVQINGQYTGNRCIVTFTVQTIDDKIIFDYGSGSTTITTVSNVMLNLGSTALPYEPYGWVHSLRKLTTATEAIENPLYSDGTAITAYTIKGNTTQSGTPTPSNPVMPNGVGERTAQLYNKNGTDISDGYVDNSYLDYNGNPATSSNHTISEYIDISSYNQITLSGVSTTSSSITNVMYDANKEKVSTFYTDVEPKTITVPQNVKYVRLTVSNAKKDTLMLNEGSTAKSYEPYGYKIPISSGQTVNNYLGSIQSTRQIKKYEFTGQEDWGISGGVFWLGEVSPDYRRLYQTVSYYCTHYICYQQTGAATNVPDKNIAFGYNSAVQRIYLHDSTYSDVNAFKTYLQQQYAAGTPVTVWYVLATETTAIVNELLMKIGTYADTLSNATAIPTTEGANSITVDTTVQPSEFSATWTGWHDSAVKEYDGSDWQ